MSKSSDFSKELENNDNNDNVKVSSCPNCGATLNSYSVECPYCHSEIRNVKISVAIDKFSKGLEKIKSKEMPQYNGKESLLKKLVGADLEKDLEKQEKLKHDFKINQNEEIANYIKNYPVPNGKEDLIEFMILATTNINVKSNDSDEIKKAWITKMNQIYEKSKITFKNSNDMKIIEELYNNKKQELKSKKVDSVFYIAGGILLYIMFLIMISNFFFSLAFIFISFDILLILYYLINKENSNFFNTPLKLTKKIVKIACITMLVFSLLFGIIGIIQLNYHDENYMNYYNKNVKKYNVEIIIDFKENLFFNKYDVKLSIYDIEKNISHGIDKNFNIKLPNGTHELKFTGDGMQEIVKLEVKGDTKVKYRISCHEDEIKVSELDLEYLEEKDNSKKEDNKQDKEPKEPETSNVIKPIIMVVLPSEYLGMNYKEVEEDLKELGFTNIKLEKKETSDINNKNDSIADFKIAGKDYERFTEFQSTDEVKIVYWVVNEEQKKDSVSYSTNDKETAKDGNKGVYAYKSRGGQYDIYWIIDFDKGYVYNFFEGNGEETCEQLNIDHGNLNEHIQITWHDGGTTWSYKLKFKLKRIPSILIVQDNDGFEYEYYETNLKDALKIRDAKRIVKY